MKKVQPEEGESADIVSDNIERLKELFPSAFSEGRVDFEVLRQLLGDAKVLDESDSSASMSNWSRRAVAPKRVRSLTRALWMYPGSATAGRKTHRSRRARPRSVLKPIPCDCAQGRL